MNEKVKAFQRQLDDTVAESVNFCFMSRANEFQIEARDELRELKEAASKLKEEMIENGDEESANALLGLEAEAKAIISELDMWIALKEDSPGAAWDCLVTAQEAARGAMRAYPAIELGAYTERLAALEKLLFPPQLYLSSGMIIDYTECSICGGEYGDCGHVRGKAYMGKFCCEVVKKIRKLNEVSIVKEPADKRCRIERFSEGGVMRDLMTWRPCE